MQYWKCKTTCHIEKRKNRKTKNLNKFCAHCAKAMVHMKKRREDRNTKIWIFWEQKELFRWNKKAFSIVIYGLLFGEKNENKK